MLTTFKAIGFVTSLTVSNLIKNPEDRFSHYKAHMEAQILNNIPEAGPDIEFDSICIHCI